MEGNVNKTEGAIIILGSPNDEQGNLLSIAVERLTQGIKEFTSRPGFKILLTGGWGAHFNRTKLPHAEYAKRFLMMHGVPEQDMLEFALSNNTVEDALHAKLILDHHLIKKVVVVSSDFHTERVRFIFGQVLNGLDRHTVEKGYDVEYAACQTNMPREKLDSLLARERRMMDLLKQEGIVSRSAL